MRKDEFVMRGQTDSTGITTETLNFSGFKPGYAYKLTEFSLYPATNVGGTDAELCASITASKTAEDPQNPDFGNEGLIATSNYRQGSSINQNTQFFAVINDTFLITQNLTLTVNDSQNNPVNWQCKFEPVKMSGAEEAVTNYKQFAISDGS